MASNSHTYEIAPDDEDLELQDDLVATSRDGLLPTHLAPAAHNKGKGKERATSPTGGVSHGLEGRIGTAAAGASGGQRQTAFGGIQTETRSVPLPRRVRSSIFLPRFVRTLVGIPEPTRSTSPSRKLSSVARASCLPLHSERAQTP